MKKESRLPPTFRGRNGDVPYQNLAGRTLEPARLRCAGGDAQVGEAMAMVKALNRMTLLGMPHSVRIV